MADLPREFRGGVPLADQLTASRLNQLLAAIRQQTPLPGRGTTTRVTGSGTCIDLAPLSKRISQPTAQAQPFQLEIVNNGTTETPDWKVRVYASTLAGGSSLDLGFAEADDPPFLLTASAGVVQAGLTIDETGAVTSRWIEIVPTLSADTDTDFYVELGTVAENDGTFTATNSRYGPIDATICRNWFSNPPTYSVTFFTGPQ